MKLKMATFMVFSLIFLLSNTAHAQQGNVTIENENIVVNITGGGNVPKFSFNQPNSTDTYRIQFHKMFEVVDTNANNVFDSSDETVVPQSVQALASWSWDFSDVQEVDGESTFNITSQGAKSPTKGNFEVIFVNHLGDNASSFKFDVIVNDYEFTSEDENAMLVLAFSLTTPDGDDEPEQENNSVEFGDAYMEVEETASSGDSSIGVGLTTPSNGSSIAYIAYENFNGSFVHDPEVGFTEYTSSENSANFGFTFITISVFVILPILRKLRN